MAEYIYESNDGALRKIEEIIRCRDCRCFETITRKAPDGTEVVEYSCCRFYSIVDSDGFCAWAERDEVGLTNEEIIRCCDCKHYIPETVKFSDGVNGSDCDVVPFCDKLRRETKPNGFCAL